jgi:flagellar biosynthesis GTPase FlhF
MVLLHGFIKKTQKTPPGDLELARKNKALHESELKRGEMTMANGTVGIHSGSSFDDFLEEEGYRDEVESAAIKRVLAWQFEQEMTRQQKTKRAMAAELKTSRSQLDRLLDPQNTAVSLDTLTRAAHILGKRLVLEIRDIPSGAGSRRRTIRESAKLTVNTASVLRRRQKA